MKTKLPIFVGLALALVLAGCETMTGPKQIRTVTVHVDQTDVTRSLFVRDPSVFGEMGQFKIAGLDKPWPSDTVTVTTGPMVDDLWVVVSKPGFVKQIESIPSSGEVSVHLVKVGDEEMERKKQIAEWDAKKREARERVVAAHPDWSEEIKKAVRNEQIFIGMPSDAVDASYTESRGLRKVYTSTDARGTWETWDYGWISVSMMNGQVVRWDKMGR